MSRDHNVKVKAMVHLDYQLQGEQVVETVRLEMTPDEEWVDFVCGEKGYADIFGHNYCGYWMRGMEHDPKLGWLVYEHGDERKPDKKYAAEVEKLWREGKPLPPFWFRLDRRAALLAQAHGAAKWGAHWYGDAHTDATSYDVVIQLALLGEVRYG